MASWIKITEADIEARMPSTAMATLRERYVDAATDPLVLIIADITSIVRGRVDSNDAYQVDVDATLIPPELKDDACWLCVEGLKLRIADVAPISDCEANRIAEARKSLDKVTKGELSISIPDNPRSGHEVQMGNKISMVSGNPRRNTRERLSGLL